MATTLSPHAVIAEMNALPKSLLQPVISQTRDSEYFGIWVIVTGECGRKPGGLIEAQKHSGVVGEVRSYTILLPFEGH